jgi:tRNA (cmo5U34)-methyltransferase
MTLTIPENWTFKSADVASGFDRHVREQLPWYDLATSAVAHFGRHYIPRNGLVYDIGASTGNIGNALRETLEQRGARLIAIEESEEMAAQYRGPGEVVVSDAIQFPYDKFDFAALFLVLMFLPIHQRSALLYRLWQLLKPGGAIVVVDKIATPAGYCGTALRRLALAYKLETKTSPDDILRKELSLAGYQRPIVPSILPGNPQQFFMMGEFCGWIIDKGE